ncbi:MAG: YfhO family protein [Verrucomicrobiota bacterium]|nr:YfhO family protein [Verrucomicrobiota bacterium]
MNLPFLSTERSTGWLKPFAGAAAVLLVVTLFLFWDSLDPALILFSNDGPLGSISTDAIEMPGTFSGYWHDLNWLGYEQPSASPGIYMALGLLLQKSVLYLKWCTPICLVILGLSAWFFFRTLGFRNLACTIGAVAAAFNMEVVSYACWGLPSRSLTFATSFLAGAFVLRALKSRPCPNLALAGICVGLGLMEGYDIGALFSLYIAAFVLFGFVIKRLESEKPVALGQAAGRGFAGVALVALVAGLAASQTMSTLVDTQLKGTGSDPQTPAQRDAAKERQWTFLTQWSLPKMETLRIVIPGLYGYRLDTPRPYDGNKLRSLDGGNYWGSMGQDPVLDRVAEVEEVIAAFGQRNVVPGELASALNVSVQKATQLMALVQNKNQFLQRHSGSGEYAGIIVVLLAAWALFFALQKRANIYSPTERRMILFWTVLAVVSLLLAYGRHAVFYQLIHQLPFFNTMRNPIKFLHPMHLGLIVLCGYSIEGLLRLAKREAAEPSRAARLWIRGTGIAAGLMLLGSLIFGASKKLLGINIASRGFDPAAAQAMASFSVMEIILSALLLGVGALLIAKVMRGNAAAKWAVALGLLILIDLTRANSPWVQYDDYKHKYEGNNPLISTLAKSPHEGRVTISPLPSGLLNQLYRMEWLQHQFLYNNVQSLDLVQMPRMATDHEAFERRFTITGDTNTHYLAGRRWELTNTRWILGGTNDVAFFNRQFDPAKSRFTVASNFVVGLRPGTKNPNAPGTEDFTTQFNSAGPYSLIRFDGALPRARLYSQWQVQTNDATTLETLAKREFDPQATVIVNAPIAPSAAALGQAVGEVITQSYRPKEIRLTAQATGDSVLLLNDHWSAHWRVTVDGQPSELLRCNYVMRGVRLSPGSHEVVFRFQPPMTWLYVSLASLLGGFGLLGFVIVDERKNLRLNG